MQSETWEKIFLFEIMAFELAARNSAYRDAKTCLFSVNVLTNSLKISDMTRANVFQLNLAQIQGKVF